MEHLPPPPCKQSTAIRLVPVLLGLAGIVAMVTFAAIGGMFLPWHYALGALSVTSILGGLAWLNEARWKEMLSGIIYTVFFVVCLGFLYLISANRDGRWDLTENRVHTLSNLTLSILQKIPVGERISVQSFSPATGHPAVQQFLSSYQRSNSQIAYDLYDAQRDLNVVMDLGGDVKNGEVVITRYNDAGTVVRRETSKLDVGSDTRENDLTNALARMFSSDQQVVYFTMGHGERRFDDKPESVKLVANQIAAKGIPVKQLRLMEGHIPDDAGVIVIAGPTIDLLDFEREMLDQYLANGGKLLVLIDPIMQASNPLTNMEQLLVNLNVQAKNVFVVDPDAVNITGLPLTPLAAMAKHPITDATNKAPFVLETARELLPVDTNNTSLTQEALLVTTAKVWSEPADHLKSTRRAIPPDDPKEIHTRCVGVALEKKTAGGRYGELMRVVIVTDSDAFTDGMVEKNGDAGAFFIQSVQWLRQQDDMLQVPPKFLKSTPVTMTQSTTWIILTIYVIIGLLVTVGGSAWTIARRRSR